MDRFCHFNVRLICSLALEGYGPGKIVKALYERGISTPGEYKTAQGIAGHDVSHCRGVWPASTVIKTLDDERYTGTYIIGKREVTEVGGPRMRMKDENQWIKILCWFAILTAIIFSWFRKQHDHHDPKEE